MPSQIPAPIQGQKYISLTTFRKTGVGVATPVWFGEEDGKLYVMTRGDMGKTKRIRNNPQVRVAPCTMRGTVTGAEFACDGAYSAARRACAGAPSDQSQVLGGADSVVMVEDGYVFGAELCISREREPVQASLRDRMIGTAVPYHSPVVR